VTNKFILFIIAIFFLFGSSLWAQSPPPGGSGRYVIEQRYVQNLVWIGDEYTLKYEVIIEQEDEGGGAPGGALGGYRTYIREFTEKQSFQVSLPVGKYRYRIIPYDYLEQPGEASDWVNIEIKPAPIVPAEVQKEDDDSYVIHPDETEDGSYVIHPVEDEQTAPCADETVVVSRNDTVTAGADETEKLLNLFVNAAWTPLIPLFGRMSEVFDKKFYALGASVRFGALFNKPRWFNPGVELSMSWYGLNSDRGGDKIDVQTGVTGINILAQKKLPNPKMAVTVRAGFALIFQVGEVSVEDYAYSTGGLIPQISFEASFLWFAYKSLYLEGGIEFAYLIDKNTNSGCLRPWIGAGWKF